jgi:molybdopterin-containing oxidoreductase family iron-sulfur binding subunit
MTQNAGRRGFLKKVGGVAVATLVMVSGGFIPKLAKAGRRKARWGMVIDLQRCVLCRSCTVACKQENKTPPEMMYNPVLEEEAGEYPKISRRWFPRPCMHCDKPACLEACPVHAIKKRDDGIVFIDPNICVGVQACVPACPYGVPIFDEGKQYHDGKGVWSETSSPELGLMQKPSERIFSNKSRKCSFCLHKQYENGEYVNLPACAKTCMGKAIHFGDLGDPDGELQTLLKTRKNMRLKEEAGTGPNVYYLT